MRLHFDVEKSREVLRKHGVSLEAGGRFSTKLIWLTGKTTTPSSFAPLDGVLVDYARLSLKSEGTGMVKSII